MRTDWMLDQFPIPVFGQLFFGIVGKKSKYKSGGRTGQIKNNYLFIK